METQLHRSVGTLRYTRVPGYGFRLVLEIDKGIPLFYRSLIPKWFPTSGQRHTPHISVVRREVPTNLKAWGKYEGERIEFFYSHDIQRDNQYWWLDCFSTRLEEIREELGLPLTSFRKPADGFRKVWHTTVANEKETA